MTSITLNIHRCSRVETLLLFSVVFAMCTESFASVQISLSSTISNSSRVHVCPNETVFYYCTLLNASDVTWRLPEIKDAKLRYTDVSFFSSDGCSYDIKGPITVWLDTDFTGTLIRLPYSPEFNNAHIICRSGSLSQNYTYELAVAPPPPSNLRRQFLDSGHIKVMWDSVVFAEYYIITTPYTSFVINGTSVIIEYFKELNVVVSSVNECHMSSDSISILIQIGTLEWLIVNLVYILIVSLSDVGVAIVAVVIVIVIVYCRRGKKYSVKIKEVAK